MIHWSYDDLIFSLVRNWQTIFQSGSIIAFSLSVNEGFSCSTSLPVFGVVSVPGFVHCNRCVVVSRLFLFFRFIYLFIYNIVLVLPYSNNMMNFLGGSVVKNPSANVGVTGDVGLISGSGKSPRVGNDHTLQYYCQESSMNRGTWWTIVHRVTNSWAPLSDWACMHVTTWHRACFHMLFCYFHVLFGEVCVKVFGPF